MLKEIDFVLCLGMFIVLVGFFGCGKFIVFNVVVGFVVLIWGYVVLDGLLIICLGLDVGIIF